MFKRYSKTKRNSISPSYQPLRQASSFKKGRNQTLGSTSRLAMSFSKMRVKPRSSHVDMCKDMTFHGISMVAHDMVHWPPLVPPSSTE